MSRKEISVKISADSKSAEKSMGKVTAELNKLSASTSKSDGIMGKAQATLKRISAMFGQLASSVSSAKGSIDRLDSKPIEKVGKAAERAGAQAKKGANNIKSIASSMEKLNTIGNAIAGVQLGGAAAGVVSNIVSMGVASIQAAAQMRQYEIAFQTMLKSASEGTQMLRDLQKFAAETPFDVPGVVSAGQQLMAFGFKAKEIVPMLTSLGDAASGLGLGTEGVSRLAYALGQMRTSGKLNAQDMMQLTSAGVSAWDMLAQAAGKSVAEIKDLCSKGMIDSKEAVKIIVAGMNNEFGGMMDKTSNEVAGLLANIEETAGNTSAAVGRYLTDAFNIKGILKNVSDALGDFQQKMQTATDQGKSFTDVVKECVPGSVVVAVGALAAVIGGALVAAIGAAVAAIGAAIGLSLTVVAVMAAVGAALAAVVVYWDEIVDAFNVGVNSILTLITLLGTAITEGILGIVKFISGSIGEIFADATGKQDNWFNNFASMLGDAMKAVEQFARNAISWFNEVFAAKNAAVDTRNGNAELAQIQEDGKVWEAGKKTTVKSEPASLFIEPTKKSKSSGRSAKKSENLALKAAQKENKVAQERLKIRNEYTKQALAKEKALWNAQNAIAKQYGTDAQKYQLELDEIQFNKKQELQQEALAYSEQVLAAENAIKEAQLRGASQKELDMLKEKLQLIKDTHTYNMETIEKTAATNTANAQFGYNTTQTNWQAQYNASDTVKQMTMANDKWYNDATNSVNSNPWANEQMKLEMLTAINKKYDEQKEKINTISKLQQASNQLAKDFSGAVADWVTGAKTFGDAMKEMLKNLIAQLIQAVVYATILAALGFGGGSTFGARFKSNFGKAFASGGSVDGPGTGTSDSIPAMLSNGEYVLNAKAVDALGIPFLNGLNTGRLKGFASGGYVSSSGYKAAGGQNVSSPLSSQTITLNVSAIDASGFADLLARGGLQVIKQAFADDNRNFNAAFGTF